MLKVSKLEEAELLEVLYQIIKRINFINESTIPPDIIKAAYELTKGIDQKDMLFIAMAEHLHCKVWSGDTELIAGLRRKGYKNIISVLYHSLLRLRNCFSFSTCDIVFAFSISFIFSLTAAAT